MARKDSNFIVSVEPRGGKTWQVETKFVSLVDARAEAETQFRGIDAITVAVMQGGKIRDVFDGRWSSECDWRLDDA